MKKLLSVDDLTTNYLVYSPCVYNRPDDNWKGFYSEWKADFF